MVSIIENLQAALNLRGKIATPEAHASAANAFQAELESIASERQNLTRQLANVYGTPEAAELESAIAKLTARENAVHMLIQNAKQDEREAFIQGLIKQFETDAKRVAELHKRKAELLPEIERQQAFLDTLTTEYNRYESEQAALSSSMGFNLQTKLAGTKWAERTPEGMSADERYIREQWAQATDRISQIYNLRELN